MREGTRSNFHQPGLRENRFCASANDFQIFCLHNIQKNEESSPPERTILHHAMKRFCWQWEVLYLGAVHLHLPSEAHLEIEPLVNMPAGIARPMVYQVQTSFKGSSSKQKSVRWFYFSKRYDDHLGLTWIKSHVPGVDAVYLFIA